MNANENKPYKSHKALQPKVKGALSVRTADTHTTGKDLLLKEKFQETSVDSLRSTQWKLTSAREKQKAFGENVYKLQ